MQELETLYAQGEINLFYGDESHVCTELSFPNDDSLKKSVYLIAEIEKKWTMPIHNWGLILNQFLIIFGEKLKP